MTNLGFGAVGETVSWRSQVGGAGVRQLEQESWNGLG